MNVGTKEKVSMPVADNKQGDWKTAVHVLSVECILLTNFVL